MLFIKVFHHAGGADDEQNGYGEYNNKCFHKLTRPII